ncbi:DUF1048 domain-containing protein [Nocardia concava]|uniref:DUF1048 domain-containing protein n=1 Tax=Nocardia concava TaxID=257281 RepID=UPI000311A60C|nr:DUF1048 domain-containing protein [Nocardia concava]
MTTFLERIVGDLGDKRRWREHRAHVKALPAQYRTTVEALERYLSHLGGVTLGDLPAGLPMPILEDLTGLFEQAAMNGTPPIAAVIGADPVEFAEVFLHHHTGVHRVSRAQDPELSAIEREFHQEVERGLGKERKRLTAAVERAEVEGRQAV